MADTIEQPKETKAKPAKKSPSNELCNQLREAYQKPFDAARKS